MARVPRSALIREAVWFQHFIKTHNQHEIYILVVSIRAKKKEKNLLEKSNLGNFIHKLRNAIFHAKSPELRVKWASAQT